MTYQGDRKSSSGFFDITTCTVYVNHSKKSHFATLLKFFALKIQIFDELAIKQFDFIFCLKWDIFLDFHPWCSSWFLVQFVVCWFVFRQQRRNLQRKIKTAKPSISLAIIIRFKGHSKIFFQTFWDHLAKKEFWKVHQKLGKTLTFG